MSIDSVRKAFYLIAVTALFIIFCGYAPAGEINHEPIELPGPHLAQITQESANEQSETPRNKVLAQAEPAKEDEDEYDEYGDMVQKTKFDFSKVFLSMSMRHSYIKICFFFR